MKKGRKARTSSGNRKNHDGENRSRRESVHVDAATSDFVRRQAGRRWPEPWQEEKYAQMNSSKHFNKGRATGKARIAPREVTFPLLHELSKDILNKIMVASSLKLKHVRRDPGFVLIRTYNLKQRAIVFM